VLVQGAVRPHDAEVRQRSDVEREQRLVIDHRVRSRLGTCAHLGRRQWPAREVLLATAPLDAGASASTTASRPSEVLTASTSATGGKRGGPHRDPRHATQEHERLAGRRLTRYEPGEFALRPRPRHEGGRQQHNAAPRGRQTLIDLATQAITDEELELVKPDAVAARLQRQRQRQRPRDRVLVRTGMGDEHIADFVGRSRARGWSPGGSRSGGRGRRLVASHGQRQITRAAECLLACGLVGVGHLAAEVALGHQTEDPTSKRLACVAFDELFSYPSIE